MEINNFKFKTKCLKNTYSYCCIKKCEAKSYNSVENLHVIDGKKCVLLHNHNEDLISNRPEI